MTLPTIQSLITISGVEDKGKYNLFKTDVGNMSVWKEHTELTTQLIQNMSKQIEVTITTNEKGIKNIRSFIGLAPKVETVSISSKEITDRQKVPQETMVSNDFGCKLRYKQNAQGKWLVEVCGCKMLDATKTDQENKLLLASAERELARLNKGVVQ